METNARVDRESLLVDFSVPELCSGLHREGKMKREREREREREKERCVCVCVCVCAVCVEHFKVCAGALSEIHSRCGRGYSGTDSREATKCE